MNQYGAQAKRHWARWLPNRYSQIPDPEAFFTDLGEQVWARVDELSRALAGEDPPGETYMEKLGRLNMARLNAEEAAMKELALLEPEPTAEGAEERDA
jgi:hypothetical protein